MNNLLTVTNFFKYKVVDNYQRTYKNKNISQVKNGKIFPNRKNIINNTTNKEPVQAI